MNTPVAGMVVDIEARIDKLEKGLAKANRSHSGFANDVERRAKRSADSRRKSYGDAADGIGASFLRLAKQGPAALGLIGTAATGAVVGLAKVTGQLAEVGALARRAGVDAQSLQSLGIVAARSKVGMDPLVDALKELAIRGDEFAVTGKGAGAEAFARLGFGASDLADRLKDPSALFVEIMERLEALNDTAAQVRIADEIFGGTGGEQLVQMLGQGQGKIRELAAEARNSGAVLDNDLIRRAEELDRRFTELAQRSKTFFQAVVIGAVDAGAEVLDLRASLDSLFAGDERARGILGPEIADKLAADRDAVEAHRQELEALNVTYRALADEAAGLEGQLLQAAASARMFGEARLADELVNAAEEAYHLSAGLADGSVSAEEFEGEMAAVLGTANAALGELQAIDGATFAGVTAALGGLIGRLAEAAARAAQLRSLLPGASAAAGAGSGSGRGGDPRAQGGSFADWAQSTATDNAPTASSRPRPAPNDPDFGAPVTAPPVRPLPAPRDVDFGLPPARSSGGGGRGGSSRSSRAGRGGGGGGSARPSDYRREAERIRETTRELELEAVALAAVSRAHEDMRAAIEDARMSADLLGAAMRSGRTDNAALRAEIAATVTAHRQAADAASQVKDRLDGIADARRQLEGAAENAFVGLVKGTLSWKDALGQVLDTILEIAAKSVFQGFLGGMGGGLFGGVGKLFGFSSGGYTGRGGTLEPAGVVHRGEFVFSKVATEALGVANLDSLHAAARRGYSGGGVVGGGGSPKALLGLQRPATRQDGAITIHAPVTVNANGGSAEANADLAARVGREMEATMRGVVVDELRRQSRPGAMLHGRR